MSNNRDLQEMIDATQPGLEDISESYAMSTLGGSSRSLEDQKVLSRKILSAMKFCPGQNFVIKIVCVSIFFLQARYTHLQILKLLWCPAIYLYIYICLHLKIMPFIHFVLEECTP